MITILLTAIALSMDTFSLAIIYGTLGLEKKKIIILSTTVGIFHFFMPLLGNMIGELIFRFVPIEATTIAGVIFLAIAVQMLLSLFKKEEAKLITNFFSIVLFAFTVSIDSFSVGIGLNAISPNHILAVTIFMIISFLFTLVGLIMGKKLNQHFGSSATLLGSLILFGLSIHYIFFIS